MGLLLCAALGIVSPALADEFDSELPSIREIEFVGNSAFDAKALRAQMGFEFPSLTHPLRSWPRFRRNTFGRELRELEIFYRRRGFGGASARLDSVVTLDEGRAVHLRVHIREGPHTRIRELRFLPQSVYSLDELRAIVPFAVGDAYPFNAAELGRATRALRLAFLTRGYLAVGVRDSTQLTADSSAAVLVYALEPGKQFTVRAVSVSGNYRTRPYVVQRELKIQPGQVYSYPLIEASKQNLYSTGLFRSVTIREEDPDPVASTVDLAVRLTERENAFVESAVGFGRRDDIEAKASAAWGHRNLWGRGQNFQARATVAYNLQLAGDHYFTQARLHYSMPHFFGTQLRWAPDLAFTIDQRQDNVHLREARFDAPLTRQFGRFTTAGVGARASLSTTTLVKEQVTDDRLQTQLVYASVTRNALDDIFNPRSGDVRALSAERAGFWGKNDFTRLSGLYSRFMPLGAGVLALSLRAGWVEAYGSSRAGSVADIGIEGVPFEYLFQAGGSSTVRGFDNYSLGTPLTVTQTDVSSGQARVDTVNVNAGTVLFLGNLELRHPAPYLGPLEAWHGALPGCG